MRQRIAKRTGLALAQDLLAWKSTASPGDEGTVTIEVRRKRGNVDLGPERRVVHESVLRARCRDWAEKQLAKSCGVIKVAEGVGPEACDAWLHFMYTAALLPDGKDNYMPCLLKFSGARHWARLWSSLSAKTAADGLSPAEQQLCDDIEQCAEAGDLEQQTDSIFLCAEEKRPREKGGGHQLLRLRVFRPLLLARADFFKASLSERWITPLDQKVDTQPGNDEQSRHTGAEVVLALAPGTLAAFVSWLHGSLSPLPAECLPELLHVAEYYGVHGLGAVVS